MQVDWVSAQAFAEAQQVMRPQASDTSPEVAPACSPCATPEASPAPPPPPDWAPLRASNLPKVGAWEGLKPDGADIANAPYPEVTKPARNWWAPILASGLLLIVLLVALALQSKRQSAVVERQLKQTAKAPSTPVSIPRPAPTPSATSKGPSVSSAEAAKAGQDLLAQFFASAGVAPERFIAESARHADSVQSFFQTIKAPVELQAFRTLPTAIKFLPEGQAGTLCELKTSLSSTGTAITRLLPDKNGKLLLDWPMLRDSLLSALHTFSQKPGGEPAWITLGVRRGFGYGQTTAVRNAYLFFDIQGQGDGADRTEALALKSSPTGRALERAIAWNELYMVRLLLHWQEIEGEQRIIVLDAELLPGASSAGE